MYGVLLVFYFDQLFSLLQENNIKNCILVSINILSKIASDYTIWMDCFHRFKINGILSAIQHLFAYSATNALHDNKITNKHSDIITAMLQNMELSRIWHFHFDRILTVNRIEFSYFFWIWFPVFIILFLIGNGYII